MLEAGVASLELVSMFSTSGVVVSMFIRGGARVLRYGSHVVCRFIAPGCFGKPTICWAIQALALDTLQGAICPGCFPVLPFSQEYSCWF